MSRARICPNLSDPEILKEFSKIVATIDPKMSPSARAQAHYLWDKYNGKIPLTALYSSTNKTATLYDSSKYEGEQGKQEFKDDIATIKTIFINLLNSYAADGSKTNKEIIAYAKKLIGDADNLGGVPRWFLKRSVSINGKMLPKELFAQYVDVVRYGTDEEVDAFLDNNNIDTTVPKEYLPNLTEEQDELIGEKFYYFGRLWLERSGGNYVVAGYQNELITALEAIGYKMRVKESIIPNKVTSEEEFGVTEEANLGTYEKIYALRSFEQSVMKGKKGQIAKLLSKVLTSSPNYLGMQTYQDPVEIYRTILPILNGAKNIQEILNRLSASPIVSKTLTNLPETIENFSEIEKIQFLGLFNLNKQEYRAIIQSLEGTRTKTKLVKYVNVEAGKVGKQATRDFKTAIVQEEQDIASNSLYTRVSNGFRINSRRFDPEAYKSLTDNPVDEDGNPLEPEVISEDFVQRMNDLVQNYNLAFSQADWGDLIYLTGRILFELGIDLTKTNDANDSALALFDIITEGNNPVYIHYKKLLDVIDVDIIAKNGFVDKLFETTTDKNRISTIKKLNSKIVSSTFVDQYKSRFTKLAELTMQGVVESAESFVNARGNSTYPWQLPSFLDNFLQEIKSSEKTDAFFEKFEKMISVASADYPEFASYLYTQFTEDKVQHFEVSDVVLDSEETKDVSDLTERERLILHIDAYIGRSESPYTGFFNLIADGDRKRVPFLQLKKIWINNQNIREDWRSGNTAETPQDIIRNIIIRDLRRIAVENKNENLKSVFPRLDGEARFSLSGMKDTEVGTTKLSSMIESMLENQDIADSSAIYKPYWEEIDRMAAEWISTTLPQMVEELKETLVNYKLISSRDVPKNLGKVTLTKDQKTKLKETPLEGEVIVTIPKGQVKLLEGKEYIEDNSSYFTVDYVDSNGEVTLTKVNKEDVEFISEVSKTRFAPFNKFTKGTLAEQLDQLLTGFVFDKAVYKVEFVDMFSGGKSRFKSIGDIYKRWSLFSTPGARPILKRDADGEEGLGMSETFNELSINDLKLYEEIHRQLSEQEFQILVREREKLGQQLNDKTLKELREIADSKLPGVADIADAIAFISEDFDVDLRQGYYHEWSEEDRAKYDLYKETGAYTFDILPHKFIYINTRNTGNEGEGNFGDIQQVFDADKNSYFVITKEMAAKSDSFKRIYDLMKSKNVQVLNIKSGKKGTKDNLYSLQTQDGEYADLSDATPTIQRADSLYMVQRVSRQSKDRIVIGKQLRNNQLTNILNNDTIVLNKTLPGKEVKLTGKEVKELYAAIFDELLNRKKLKVDDAYGISRLETALDNIGTIVETGEGDLRLDSSIIDIITYKNELVEKLRSKILSDEEVRQGALSQELIEKTTLESTPYGLDFPIPLSFPGNNKFTSVLTRVRAQEIFDVSLPGKNYVVAAAPGKFKVFNSTLGKYEETPRELRMYQSDEENIYGAEIAVSPDFLEKFGFDIGESIDLDKLLEYIPAESLEALGARTPHTGKSSTIAFRIAALLPKNYSKHVLVPGNIVTVTGMDFDFDKLFVYFFNLETYNTAEGQIVLRTEGVYTPEDVKNVSTQSLENTLLEIMIGIQLDPKHHEEAVTPLNTNMYEDFINTFITDDYRETSLRFESPLYDVKTVTRYQTAAKLVGIHANSYTGMAVLTTAAQQINTANEIGVFIQRSKHVKYIDTGEDLVVNGVRIYEDKTSPTGDPINIAGNPIEITLDKIVSTSPITGRPITYFFTKNISGAVDAGNNPYQESWNENQDTVNAKIFLESLGIDANIVGLLINSDKVREFSEKLNNFRSNGTFTTFAEIGLEYSFLQDVLNFNDSTALPPLNVQDLYFVTAYRKGDLDSLIASLPETSPGQQTVETEEGVQEDFGIQFMETNYNSPLLVSERSMKSTDATIYLGVATQESKKTKGKKVKADSVSKLKNLATKNDVPFLEVDLSGGLEVTQDQVDQIVGFLSIYGGDNINIEGSSLFESPTNNQSEVNQFVKELFSRVTAQVELQRITTGGESGIQEAVALAGKDLEIETVVFATKDLRHGSRLGNNITNDRAQFYSRYGVKDVQFATKTKGFDFKSVEELEERVGEIEISALKLFAGAYYAGKDLSSDLSLLTPDKIDESTDFFIFLEYLQKLNAREFSTRETLISLNSIQEILTGNQTLQASYVRAIQNIVETEKLGNNIFASDAMLNILDTMRTLTDKRFYTVKELKLITRMLNYWMLTQDGSPIGSWFTNSTLERMYFNDDPDMNLGARLEVIKKNPKLAKNKFVQRLQTQTMVLGGREFEIVVFSKTDESVPGEMDEFKRDFADILERPSKFYKAKEDQTRLKEFAKDLIYNNFFTTGLSPAFGNYFNMIPQKFFTRTQPGEKMSIVQFYRKQLNAAMQNPSYFEPALFDIIRSIGHNAPESYTSIIPRYNGKVVKEELDLNDTDVKKTLVKIVNSKIETDRKFASLNEEEQKKRSDEFLAEAIQELESLGEINISTDPYTQIEEELIEDAMDEDKFYETEAQVENFVRKNLPVFITRKTGSKTYPIMTYIRTGEVTYTPIEIMGMGKRFVELNIRDANTGKILRDSVLTKGLRISASGAVKSIPARSEKYIRKALSDAMTIKNQSNTVLSKTCKI